MILNKNKVDSLRQMGINRTDDIVNVARAWHNMEALNDYQTTSTAVPMFNSKVMERELMAIKHENAEMKAYMKELASRPTQVFDAKIMDGYLDLVERKIAKGKVETNYKRFRP
jgi:hypothetical protein